MDTEPVLTTATVTAAIGAVLALLTQFGVDLTESQTAAILGLFATLAPLVAGLIARRRVTPVAMPRNNAGVPLFPVPTEPRI